MLGGEDVSERSVERERERVLCNEGFFLLFW